MKQIPDTAISAKDVAVLREVLGTVLRQFRDKDGILKAAMEVVRSSPEGSVETPSGEPITEAELRRDMVSNRVRVAAILSVISRLPAPTTHDRFYDLGPSLKQEPEIQGIVMAIVEHMFEQEINPDRRQALQRINTAVAHCDPE